MGAKVNHASSSSRAHRGLDLQEAEDGAEGGETAVQGSRARRQLHGPREQALQGIHVEGLPDDVEGAACAGLARDLLLDASSDDDHRHPAVVLAEIRERLQARDPRHPHPQIEEHDVRPDGGHGGEGLLAGGRGAGFIAQGLEDVAERIEHDGLIVHHEDTAAARHGTSHQNAATAPAAITSTSSNVRTGLTVGAPAWGRQCLGMSRDGDGYSQTVTQLVPYCSFVHFASAAPSRSKGSGIDHAPPWLDS